MKDNAIGVLKQLLTAASEKVNEFMEKWMNELTTTPTPSENSSYRQWRGKPTFRAIGFLFKFTRLFKLLCLPVRPFVRPFVRYNVEIFAQKLSEPLHCPCPPLRDWCCIQPYFCSVLFHSIVTFEIYGNLAIHLGGTCFLAPYILKHTGEKKNVRSCPWYKRLV